MKNRWLYTVLLVLTMVALLLPALQQRFQWFKFRPLLGVTEQAATPLDSLTENVGFKEVFVRTYNQLMWSLFSESQNKNLYVGKDRWLFNNYVMDHYTGRATEVFGGDEKVIQRMDEDAERLIQLQGLLEDHGVDFFVCIPPSKDLVCESYLPTVRPSRIRDHVRPIEYYPPLFDSLGIHYIDFSTLFVQMKDTVSYPLYYKTSSHWTNLAASYMSDTLIRYMETLSGTNMHNVTFGEPYKAWAREPDKDLEWVLNLRHPLMEDDYRYVNILPDKDSTAVKPNWLVVGDSYFRGWQYNLPWDQLFESHHYWRYNTTVYDDPLHDNTTQVDLLRELLSRDFVTVMYTPCNIYDLNRDFLTKALQVFDDQERVEKVFHQVNDPERERYRKGVLRNQEWLDSMKEKATKMGVPVEEAIEQDIDWLIMKKKENKK